MMYHHDRQISNWLLMVCAAILIMLIIGGATRLTHSSLSIVEWDSSLGWVPPSSEEAWQATFHKYQDSSSFAIHEPSLQEFKHLFMLEYSHWVWGCVIALLFVIPCLVFLQKGWVKPSAQPKLLLIFLLGGLQGLLSWYMVKIGLVNHPYASQYRLSMHLLSAFCLFGYILWVAMTLRYPDWCSRNRPYVMLRLMTFLLTIWILLMVVSGGLVAGLEAASSFDAKLFQAGQLIPATYMQIQPWYINLFQNNVTVLFNHVVMAGITVVLVLWLWFSASRVNLSWRAKSAYHFLLLMLLVQISLGMANIWLNVPVLLGVAHHICAVLLFSAIVLCNHALRFTDRFI